MYQSPLKSGHLHNLALRHRIDVVGVAIVPFSTMGSPNLVLEYTNSAPSGRTARSKLIFFWGRRAEI